MITSIQKQREECIHLAENKFEPRINIRSQRIAQKYITKEGIKTQRHNSVMP